MSCPPDSTDLRQQTEPGRIHRASLHSRHQPTDPISDQRSRVLTTGSGGNLARGFESLPRRSPVEEPQSAIPPRSADLSTTDENQPNSASCADREQKRLLPAVVAHQGSFHNQKA
jgi:hypothetical protein